MSQTEKMKYLMDDEAGEVLYGKYRCIQIISRRIFQRILWSIRNRRIFRKATGSEVDEDRGFARRHRVYKRLIFAPGMYREDGSPEDFEYLKYYGRRLSEELETDLRLPDVHSQGSAYLLSGDDCRMGTVFPGK